MSLQHMTLAIVHAGLIVTDSMCNYNEKIVGSVMLLVHNYSLVYNMEGSCAPSAL